MLELLKNDKRVNEQKYWFDNAKRMLVIGDSLLACWRGQHKLACGISYISKVPCYPFATSMLSHSISSCQRSNLEFEVGFDASQHVSRAIRDKTHGKSTESQAKA
jgi:hypothetical protein